VSQNDINYLYVTDSIDQLDDIPETTSNLDRTVASMEEFKKELTLKREARHKAIAVISSEMERLRKELAAEKEAHSETLNILTLLRSAPNNSQNVNFADSIFIRSTIKEQGKHEQWNENEKILRNVQAKRLMNIFKVSYILFSSMRFLIKICK
jgi:uncharacterized protein with von Willebrand factor type A (vWA) domain